MGRYSETCQGRKKIRHLKIIAEGFNDIFLHNHCIFILCTKNFLYPQYEQYFINYFIAKKIMCMTAWL